MASPFAEYNGDAKEAYDLTWLQQWIIKQKIYTSSITSQMVYSALNRADIRERTDLLQLTNDDIRDICMTSNLSPEIHQKLTDSLVLLQNSNPNYSNSNNNSNNSNASFHSSNSSDYVKYGSILENYKDCKKNNSNINNPNNNTNTKQYCGYSYNYNYNNNTNHSKSKLKSQHALQNESDSNSRTRLESKSKSKSGGRTSRAKTIIDVGSKSSIKIVLLGDAGSGKTSLLKRYTNNIFNSDYIPTTGAYSASKQVRIVSRWKNIKNIKDKNRKHKKNNNNNNNSNNRNRNKNKNRNSKLGRPLTLEFWDVSGLEKYHSLAQLYIHSATVVIICYDIVNRQTFNSVSRWICYAKDHMRGDTLIVLVGNKYDLKHSIDRDIDGSRFKCVSIKEAQSKYLDIDDDNLNVDMVFGTSAKENVCVTQLFEQIIQRLYTSRKDIDRYNLGESFDSGIVVNGKIVSDTRVGNGDNSTSCTC